MENEYLAHHGILGQKWGIRRYQNSDGTLTEAGKKHYSDSGDGNSSSKKTTQSKEETKKAIITGLAVSATVMAAGALYAHNPEVRNAVNSAVSTIGNKTASACKTAVAKGKDVTAKAAKTALEQMKTGAKEGLKEGIQSGTKSVVKGAVAGATIIATQKMLNAAIGEDKVNDSIKAYNAYNKKNKINMNLFSINNSGDDRDDR